MLTHTHILVCRWFWPRDDGTVYGQLCWSNRSLQDFLVKRVKGFLRSQPGENTVFLSDF